MSSKYHSKYHSYKKKEVIEFVKLNWVHLYFKIFDNSVRQVSNIPRLSKNSLAFSIIGINACWAQYLSFVYCFGKTVFKS